MIYGPPQSQKESTSLLDSFRTIGVELTVRQLEQFEIYQGRLLAWNARAGLISRNDEARIVERHFLESAALVNLGFFDCKVNVLDLGTGGGFPGVPIKILRPEISLTLLDSRRIKTLFLKNLVEKLLLEEISVVCERAENVNQHADFENKFGVVLSRAVADLTKVYRWSRAFIKSGGVLVTIKGSNLKDEEKMFRKRFPLASISIITLPSCLGDSAKNQRIVCVTE